MNTLRKKYQSGITLITSLMMLLAMTIIGVTAVQVSTVDLLVANNYQQQLAVYQEAESKLRGGISFYHLHDWMMSDKQPPNTRKGSLLTTAKIVDLDREYPCKGRSNLANSLGPNSPICKLFMFSIGTSMKGSGAKENHHKGVGKQFPSHSDGSYY